LGGGAIYAFERREDALRWAGKMDWEFHQETGSGKVCILTLETAALSAGWDIDDNDPFGQLGSAGQWLKRFAMVPGFCIGTCEVFGAPQMREAVAVLQGRV
jgi:hypothetical protein